MSSCHAEILAGCHDKDRRQFDLASTSPDSQVAPLPNLSTSHLFRSQNDPLILLALDDLERVKEVFLTVLDGCRILLVPGEVRVDELDQPVQIFRGDLESSQLMPSTTYECLWEGSVQAYRLIMLVKVVDISV